MASLQHPNLALIFGVETWNQLPILVVEFLAGGTLADRLRHGPLPISEVCSIGRALADTIDHLHAKGVLHRDIKPSNVGFTAENVPKVLDLGLARVLSPSASTVVAGRADRDSTATRSSDPRRSETPLTLTNQVLGTIPYLSPEALRGEEPSPSFDLWALAVTLHESLTGVHPFKADGVYETVAAIIGGEAPDARHVRPDCPPELSDLLAECLQHDPRRRPSTARQLAQKLAHVAATL
jgi:serine/threonine protein kinase